MFPRLKFKMKYYEGGSGYQGIVTFTDGRSVDDERWGYHGPRGG